MDLLTLAISLFLQVRIASGSALVDTNVLSAQISQANILAERSFSLEKRYNNTFVNDVFKDNILLTLAYMDGKVGNTVNWDEITKAQTYTFTLKPGEVFAFHQDILWQYQGKVVKTTNAHFNAQEGFKSDGLYFGDGVCHLASLMYWAAKAADLAAFRPANHDFAAINEVPKEFGTAIYFMPGQTDANAHQNLYIENNKSSAIRFVFDYNGETLSVRVEQ